MSAPSRRLLIAMDGSKHADYAFDWFLKYFYKERDDVIVIFCSDGGNINSQPIPCTDAAIISKLTLPDETEIIALATNLLQMATSSGIKCSLMRRSGQKAGEAISAAAESQKVDMVITGTRGLGTIRRTLMGSVSKYVVHHAKCPVLVVRGD